MSDYTPAYVSRLNGYLLKDAEAREALKQRECTILEYENIYEYTEDEDGNRVKAIDYAVRRLEATGAPIILKDIYDDGTKVYHNYVGHDTIKNQVYFYDSTDHEIIGLSYNVPSNVDGWEFLHHYPLNAFYLKEDYDTVNEALNLSIEVGQDDTE